jgi:Zn-dependent M32 family carboxypeptidase
LWPPSLQGRNKISPTNDRKKLGKKEKKTNLPVHSAGSIFAMSVQLRQLRKVFFIQSEIKQLQKKVNKSVNQSSASRAQQSKEIRREAKEMTIPPDCCST